MKRFIRYFLCSFISITFVYFYFIYPNPERIKVEEIYLDETTLPQLKRQFSLFHDKIPFFHTVPKEIYNGYISVLKDSYWNNLETESTNLDPYQVYLSLGQNPVKNYLKKAIILPHGESISFYPKDEELGILKTQAGTFNSDGILIIKHNGTEESYFLKKQKKHAKDTSKLFNIIRYISPDFMKNETLWEDFSLSLKANPKEPVSLKCENPNGICFISDVSFHSISKMKEKKPNVLFILVDTLHKDAIEEMPFLKDFSTKEAISFGNNFSSGNMTSPSTNSMLSCRLPHHINEIAFNYWNSKTAKESYYKKSVPSFTNLISQSGYTTAMIGNIFIISEVMGNGVDHGFDHQIDMELPSYETTQITEEFFHWSKKHQREPLFTYLHYHAMHAPYRPSLAYLLKTYKSTQDFSSTFHFLNWTNRATALYTDDKLKEVISFLKKNHLFDNTLIVITADHGEQHTERDFSHNHIGYSFFGSYMDHGGTLTNDEIRVPLIVKPVKNTKIGSIRKDGFVSNIQIAPTILKTLGLETPKWCDGKNLLEDDNSPQLLTSEGFNHRGILFDDRYKYIRSYGNVKKRVHASDIFLSSMKDFFTPEELYDLKVDPTESHNILANNKPLLQKARNYFDKAYQLETKYELVIDSPKNELIHIIFKDQPENNRHEINTKRVILELENLDNLPSVFIKTKKLPLLMSAHRMTFDSLKMLPGEKGGQNQLLPVSHSPFMYLRKITTDRQESIAIETNNAKFDAILRDWGYLND